VRNSGRGRATLATALMAMICGGLLAVPAQAGAAGAKQGVITICKSAKNGMAARSTFTLNDGAPFKLAGGACTGPLATQSGPNTVVETPGTGVAVAKITASDIVSKNLATGTVVVNVTAGAKAATPAVVTYVNRPRTTGQSGYVEVCKQAADPFVTGSFDFTITAPGFSTTRSVIVGQCTPPIQVPAGNVGVAEAHSQFSVSSIAVYPANRIVSSNVSNQTVTVVVPAGDSSTETQVTFTDASNTGSIKICKALGPNSGAVAGHTFVFTVATNISGLPSHDISVVAGAAGTTACVIDPAVLPLGTHVSITEHAVPNVPLSGISVSPASQDLGSSPPTANLAVGSGITTATFTNVTSGTVEVCKIAADAQTATQTFQFSVNGGAPISVKAGQCSLPIGVPSGTIAISEVGKPNFKLVSVTAVGPAQENRLTTSPTTNPAVVSVPTGGVENETVVTFTNAVATGQFKICKVSSESTLQGVPFLFSYSYTVNGATVTGTATLQPGQCSGLSGNIPVVDQNGQPIPVTVSEAAVAQVQVSTITVANGNSVSTNPANRTATFSVNVGFTVVTFDNVRAPL
jgi:hypothetical protein